jgi:Kef-type K+ transport system membrane component KefB
MKSIKNSLFYILITGGFSAMIYFILEKGIGLEAKKNLPISESINNHWNDFLESMNQNLHHSLALLLAQIITIIVVSRFFGWIFRRIGQPSVIGEIIAGIVLGPSLLGLYFPEFSIVLFPKESLGNLQILSQLGLILFMFVIGMELDLKILKNRANEAVVISHASIVIPFALGVGLSYYIYNEFAPENINFLSFALFIGISMSITAFPVLARIVQERGIHKTKLGAIVITCAAADDITAWCMLAAVIAIVKAGSFLSSLYIIVIAIMYVLMMFYIIKPFLKRIGDLYGSKNNLSKPVVAIFFLTLILSSYCTEIIGIHALFGAFMTGVIMPEISKFRNVFIEKVEDVSLIILLPLFFVYTGLRTEIGIINDPELMKITGYIILVAVCGKFIGSALAAKFVGQNWRDSLIIGALMNTRGLMELVVLNIGLDLGVISPKVFTMMVIMALVTTFMTGPALDLINLIFRTKTIKVNEEDELSKYKVLISFGNPLKSKALLRVANGFVSKQAETSSITAMHFTLSSEIHTNNIEDYEKERFLPINEESIYLKQPIDTIFKTTVDIETSIVEIANNDNYDFLLVGLGKSIYEGTFLGNILGFTTRIINPDRLIDKFTGKEGLFENSPFDERTRQLILKTKVPMGILVDKKFQNLNRIFVPVFSAEDSFLMDYVQKLIFNNNSFATILDVKNLAQSNFVIQSAIDSLEKNFSENIAIYEEKTVRKEFLDNQELMIISLESWKKLVESQSVWLSNVPSVLIIKP